MLNIILALCGLILFVLSLVVLYSNSKSPVNRWLGGFTLSGLIWLLANLFANLSQSGYANLLFSRLTLIGASLVPLTYLMFCFNFTGKAKNIGSWTYATIFLPIMALLALTPTSLNIKSVLNNGGIQPGIAYLFLLAILAVYFTIDIRLLVREYREAKQTRRQQLYYILLGTGMTVVPGVLLSGILPVLGVYGGLPYGPAVVIFFSVFTSIAIVRHRLLDVRLIVARSLAYTFSLLSLGAIFTAVAFSITGLLFNGDKLSTSATRLVYTVLAIALAYVFPFLKRFFDEITRKVFYRDAYDTQSFLDGFNKVLVATYELVPLLRKSAVIIGDNLKPTYTVFGIKETQNVPRRILGTASAPKFTDKDIAFVRSVTPKMRRKLIVVDELEEKYSELQKVLQANNIAVIVRLASATNEEGIGYLVLGPKKSGNLYSSQDLKNIEIIANELVIAIQNALRFEEIANFNLTLQGKVDEATKKLRGANERLKELDETKDDFISMASHQLRTPLTSVKGYISMVLEGDAGTLNTTQKKLLEQSFYSSQRMVFLIADLLNVSRLKTGKFVIEPAPVNLADMVEEEVEQLQKGAASKELTLTYEKPKEFPALMLDETKTRQVVMNFIDNAIYYTPQGGHIRVELTETPASVEMRVSDDGIGVPKHEQHHLFTKFYRAGNARKARPDGTGLGLFMAKKVVVAQGGAIIFESEEGKGSTFGFVFSKSKLAPTSVNKPKGAKTLTSIAKKP
ncbi:MAG TPA: ATP-binding protein [Candidatus Saccharimonadales bacterium]|nr:ATP-binding protein [Candidatus Saccharimonadales bacterium]